MKFYYKNYLHFYSVLKSLLISLGLKKESTISWNKILKGKRKLISKLHLDNYKDQKILIATSTGGLNFTTQIECLVSLALYIKGYEVEFILCDGKMNSCLMAQHNTISENEIINSGMKKICGACFSYGNIVISELGFKINYYSEFLSEKDLQKIKNITQYLSFDEMKNFKFEEIFLGEHAFANLLRYYSVGRIKINEKNTKIFRNFIFSSIVTKVIFDKLFNKKKFNKIFLHHAIYVPQGIVAEVALQNKIDYITWAQTYKKNSIEISKNKHCAINNITADNSAWINSSLKQEEKIKLIEHFEAKKNYRSEDWLTYSQSQNDEALLQFIKKNNLDDKSKNICLFTNIIWDAQVIFPNEIFKDMLDWVSSTVDYFHKRQYLNLIIRVHPGEVKANYQSVEKINDFLKEKYKRLNKNIFIADNDSGINSYNLADHCSLNLVYSSRIAYELSALGHNVIVSGSAFCKNKGVTLDPKSKDEYFNLLDRLPNDLPLISEERKINALKYAHYYLNKVCVEIPSLETSQDQWPPFRFSNSLIENLTMEKDNGINHIVDIITK